jgi:2-methylcitrate dehydratase PrpD
MSRGVAAALAATVALVSAKSIRRGGFGPPVVVPGATGLTQGQSKKPQ